MNSFVQTCLSTQSMSMCFKQKKSTGFKPMKKLMQQQTSIQPSLYYSPLTQECVVEGADETELPRHPFSPDNVLRLFLGDISIPRPCNPGYNTPLACPRASFLFIMSAISPHLGVIKTS